MGTEDIVAGKFVIGTRVGILFSCDPSIYPIEKPYVGNSPTSFRMSTFDAEFDWIGFSGNLTERMISRTCTGRCSAGSRCPGKVIGSHSDWVSSSLPNKM